tara:strand:- start:671 stop:1306 length:636 start_codon:yes stop_codon:yes gene_type:complete
MNFDNQTIILLGIIVLLFLLINNQNKKVCEGLPDANDPVFYCGGLADCPDLSTMDTSDRTAALATANSLKDNVAHHHNINSDSCFVTGDDYQLTECQALNLNDPNQTKTQRKEAYERCFEQVCSGTQVKELCTSKSIKAKANDPTAPNGKDLIPNIYGAASWSTSGHQTFTLCNEDTWAPSNPSSTTIQPPQIPATPPQVPSRPQLSPDGH